MKVFFDGNIFTSQKQGGISRVGFELIKNLNHFEDVEKIFYRGLHIDNYPFQKEWFKKYYGFRKPDSFNYRALNLLDSTGMELAYRADASPEMIFHSLFYRVPKNPKGPVVVHAYDMVHELFGGNAKSIAFKNKALHKADMIIAISQSTKNDIIALYPNINPDIIKVVYLGVSDLFFQRAEIRPLSDFPKTTTQRPYVLYVGPRSYAYKNFDLLLGVFIEKKLFKDFDLVVVGREALPGTEAWLRRVVCDDRGLADLYAGATVFVYPSLYEGFGLPPLEAMASGCPVLSSNASSMPEVVADAGLLFDPKDKPDFSNKLEQILKDKPLQLLLKEKGQARAKQFTWQKAAAETYEIYKSLLKSKNL